MKLTIAMRAFGALTLAALTGCSGEKSADPAEVSAMMNLRVQPEAQAYWQAVQYISDAQGSRQIVPQDDAEWKRTADAAARLKALGARMKQPDYAAGKGADWQDFAQGLVDAAVRAERAALSRKPDQVLEAGGTLYNVCSACHEVYMPSPGGLAPADPPNAAPAD